MLPIYAPFKNYTINLEQIESEIKTIPIDYFYDQTVWRKNPEVYESIDNYLIGSDEDNKNSNYFTIDSNGVNHVYYGSKPNWKCIRLTEVKNEPFSLTQNTIKRDGKWIRFREEYPEWTFREELDKYIPYTMQQIKKLPFDTFNLVRILMMQPGSFGPIHIDEGGKEFYKRNYTSVNFNIKNGNQSLKLFLKDKIINIDDKVYQINNGFPHGVETVSNERITVTVEGKINSDFLNYLDLENSVYS